MLFLKCDEVTGMMAFQLEHSSSVALHKESIFTYTYDVKINFGNGDKKDGNLW